MKSSTTSLLPLLTPKNCGQVRMSVMLILAFNVHNTLIIKGKSQLIIYCQSRSFNAEFISISCLIYTIIFSTNALIDVRSNIDYSDLFDSRVGKQKGIFLKLIYFHWRCIDVDVFTIERMKLQEIICIYFYVCNAAFRYKHIHCLLNIIRMNFRY